MGAFAPHTPVGRPVGLVAAHFWVSQVFHQSCGSLSALVGCRTLLGSRRVFLRSGLPHTLVGVYGELVRDCGPHTLVGIFWGERSFLWEVVPHTLVGALRQVVSHTSGV